MVSTRRRGKSKEDEEERVEEVEANNENEQDDDDEAPEATSSSKKKISSRSARKQQRETLRSKNLGLIRIAGDQEPKPNKIVFGDDNEHEGSGSETFHDARESLSPHEDDNQKEDDGDDDDDAVEQVNTSAARDMALAQLQQEREITKANKKTKKRRKARKVEEEEIDDDKDMLEDDFFAELDAQKSALKKAKKAKPGKDIPKHTIFSSNEETSAIPIEYNPGMELVVLGEEEDAVTVAMSLALTEPPSKNAIICSRGLIVDGSEKISQKQKQKAKKGGKLPEPTWKRSKKMNRLLLTKGRGKAAVNFVPKPTFQF